MGDLYEHIDQLAKERGFKNMTELCRTAGVPRATMTELKMGRSRDISKPNAQKLATAMGVTLDAIYGTEKTDAPRVRPSEEDIKFALFGGDGEITEAMYEEVLRFAEYVKQREQKKE
ncbi:MAG: helix-turn-helix transcriptional regulator [Oscillospiraceae bacterium]|jgi:transcriptional regulator with XRE-family HTH domain|nr:helix-turn-helix transcriptional regulator [Oscillospiraceae bacterium]